MKKGALRRQDGFVLLSLVVFLFVAALLALGDMRTLAVQQTLVATMYAAQNAMAETESALATMEQFAAFEGSELGKPEPEGNARLEKLNNYHMSCEANGSEWTDSDRGGCIHRPCNSFLYPKGSVAGDGNNNVVGAPGTVRQKQTARASTCSFCPPPTPACKARWDEAPGGIGASVSLGGLGDPMENDPDYAEGLPSGGLPLGGQPYSPWAEFSVNFFPTATTPTGNAPSNPTSSVYSTKKFYGMVEYLGWAQCNLTDMDPSGTNLDVYSDFMAAAADKTRGCRVMRVTVRNQPRKPSLPTITLQSTLLVASVLNYPQGTYNKDTPACCLLANASQPASSINKSIAMYGWVGLAGAIDAERISWRQIFPD